MDKQQLTSLCERAEELIPALALDMSSDALDPALRAHIETCAVCRKSLASAMRVGALLALAAPDVQPDSKLRERVIAAVGAAAEGRPLSAVRRAPFRAASARLRLLVAALIATILITVFGTAQYQQQWALERAQQKQAMALASLFEDPQLQRITLNADDSAAYGTLLMTPAGDQAAVILHRMPALPQGKVYQLWLVSGTTRVSGGLFDITANGDGTLLIALPAPIKNYNAIGITSEPSGGSRGPTSPRVIGTRLPASLPQN
jgi:anti-sigma-K factor RskA